MQYAHKVTDVYHAHNFFLLEVVVCVNVYKGGFLFTESRAAW